jgi:hypothetical protein
MVPAITRAVSLPIATPRQLLLGVAVLLVTGGFLAVPSAVKPQKLRAVHGEGGEQGDGLLL